MGFSMFKGESGKALNQKPTSRMKGYAATGVLAALLLWGCNLFSPLARDKTGDLDYDGLLARGSEAINHGDFAQAVNLFARAKAKNPSGSEAHLYHAQAIMSLYGHDYAKLNGEFEKKRGDSAKGLPFIDSTDEVNNIDSIYHPVFESVRDLNHILRRSHDTVVLSARVSLLPDGDTAGDGRVSEAVAQLDLGLLQTLNGMLGPLDLDGNGHIDSACGRNLCPDGGEACETGITYLTQCKNGPLSEVKRLISYQALTSNVNLKNLDSRDMKARDVSTNPNDLNAFLDAMEGPLAGANYNLESVSESLNRNKLDNLNSELSDVVGNVSDMQSFLGYMRFKDGKDNDYDAQSGIGAPTGMMRWHDYDKDGAIRWDYDQADPPTGFTREALVLGHPVHRYRHAELYLTFVEFLNLHPELKADNSINSRVALMKKHCHEIVAGLPLAGQFTGEIRDSVDRLCDVLSSTLKPNIRPPARSDWVSGPFGVDEEMIDERDNDYDGIQDEDGRNAPGLDDDNDANLTTDMIGKDIDSMQWEDATNHKNNCPDIDTDQPMKAAPLQREDCIGSIEHRIYLARNGGKAELDLVYSPFLTEGPSENCLDDYENLPQAYKDAVHPTETELRLACRYKHIWVGAMPPRSEWKAGVFGIDEEKLDGVDNDGDGWIDEDLP